MLNKYYNAFLAGIVIVVTSVAVVSAYNMRTSNLYYHSLQEEYAYITKIDFGLFNMKEWRDKSLTIFADKIENFNISSDAYSEIEVELQKYLNSIYRDYIANGKIFDEIFDGASKEGTVNPMMLTLFKNNISTQIQKLNIPRYIPSMAKTLGGEFKKNEPRIKEVLKQEIKTILNQNDRYPQLDPREAIYKKYGFDNLENTKQYLQNEISDIVDKNDKSIRLIYGVLLAMALFVVLFYSSLGFNLAIALISIISVVFLLLGISLPMIDIDVRMNSFVFSLFGQDLSFSEQTVFYQSKSILQVTKTLLEGNGLDLKIVGFMILLFSIVFPFIKLVLSSVFLYSKKLQNNRFVRGLLFHLGKWSMADVFVVALFMAYIGFYGLIEAQLGQIERNEGGFGIETVNYSSLAPGALFFATYCILSIVIGIIINKNQK